MKKQTNLILIFVILVLANNILWYLIYTSNADNKVEETDAEDTVTINMNSSNESSYSLKRKILLDGDEIAFSKLFTHEHIDNMNPEYMLAWAIIMANKYDFDEAYYEVFRAISNTCYKYNQPEKGAECKKFIGEIEYISLDHLDSLTRKFALDYLTIAANRNIFQAKQSLGQYYLIGKYLSKNEIKGKKLIREADSLY